MSIGIASGERDCVEAAQVISVLCLERACPPIRGPSREATLPPHWLSQRRSIRRSSGARARSLTLR